MGDLRSKMKDLSNKLVLVTGASAGIGKAVAYALALQGCRIALVARGKEALNQCLLEFEALGCEVQAFACDLGSADSVEKLVFDVETQMGDIDILINNVGAGTFKPLGLMTSRERDLALALPLIPAMTATHLLVPKMIKRGAGHVVNLTSPAGIFPIPYMLSYTTARQAMVGFSEALYEELRGTGVGVSLICPAQVNTGYFERNDADMGWYPKISSVFPVLEPEQVAEKVVLAIRKNKREMIFPFILRLSVAGYRLMPRTSIAIFRMLGLWKPANSR